MSDKKNLIRQDLLWYLLGSLIPLLIGLVKSPLFTRVFTTEEFGAYSLVYLSFSYISIICYSWITSCLWRYYHAYKCKGNIRSLFSNLLFIYISVTVAIFFIALLWYLETSNSLIRKLILLSFLQSFTAEIVALFFVWPRLEGKTFRYNLSQIIRTGVSFALLLIFTFIFHFRTEAFLWSNIFINVIYIIVFVIPASVKLGVSFSLVRKSELKIFFIYGKIGVLINLSTALLVSADRFLVQYFEGFGAVGIYNQNYNIAQVSIAMLIQVFWAALNPYLLPMLEKKPDNLNEKINQYGWLYIIIFAPVTFYFMIYSREIAWVMLGEDFRAGYRVIGWTAFAEFIAGMSFLPVSILKFSDGFKPLLFTYLFAILLNLGLNMALIPLYRYEIAAVTTLLANLAMWMIFEALNKQSRLNCQWRISAAIIAIIIISVHCIAHFIAITYNPSQTYFIAEGIIFATIYYWIAIKKRWIDLELIIRS